MLKLKIRTVNWLEGELLLSQLPSRFVASARNLIILEEEEYYKIINTMKSLLSVVNTDLPESDKYQEVFEAEEVLASQESEANNGKA